MGASKSKEGKVLSEPGKGGAAAPIQPKGVVIPEDAVPYSGFLVQYHMINVQVTMQHNMGFNFAPGSTMVSTNIDSYYPILAQAYSEGYRLTTFYRIPGAVKQQGFMSTAVNIPFQGIFTKFPAAPPTGKSWQLKVDKSIMFVQHIRTGILSGSGVTQADTSDMLTKIMQHTATGGQLICVEMTGQAMSQGMSAAMAGMSAGMGVDLFFDIPTHPNPRRYVYQAVNVPIGVSVSAGFPVGKINVVCDWLGQMAAFLQQGWRLVEVFLDQSATTQAHGFSATQSLNSVWFFEKDASRINDPSPVYEGTVIEYEHRIESGFTQVNAPPQWDTVLYEMGKRGWELACILETPEVRVTGLSKMKMKLLMFFQRKIPMM